MIEALGWIWGFLQWGALAVVPAAIFFGAMSYGAKLRTAILAAAIGFSLVFGWNARGVLESSKESAELRQALEERDRWAMIAQQLTFELEQERTDIRSEVNEAITELERAGAEASSERGMCRITPGELDSLRRALGFE